MKIRLVENGIFPITHDGKGKKLRELPQTGFDFPGTFQGEGKLAGVPCLFIRLSGCNLRCTWQSPDGSISICDTPYSSHHADKFQDIEIEEVVNVIKHNLQGIKHIVISGGEPTLQYQELIALARELKKLRLHLTLETNGVLFYTSLTRHFDFFSISPKLKASVPIKEKIAMMDDPVEPEFEQRHEQLRINTQTIQRYVNACYESGSYYGDDPTAGKVRSMEKDFQLKFVIARPEDEHEIKNDFLSKLHGVENEDVVLMPVGGTREYLRKSYRLTAEMAVRNRWRFTPRLQIDVWDDVGGV